MNGFELVYSDLFSPEHEKLHLWNFINKLLEARWYSKLNNVLTDESLGFL